jgi:hypothetical protein
MFIFQIISKNHLITKANILKDSEVNIWMIINQGESEQLKNNSNLIGASDFFGEHWFIRH